MANSNSDYDSKKNTFVKSKGLPPIFPVLDMADKLRSEGKNLNLELSEFIPILFPDGIPKETTTD